MLFYILISDSSEILDKLVTNSGVNRRMQVGTSPSVQA